jgi:hypothetical protein
MAKSELNLAALMVHKAGEVFGAAGNARPRMEEILGEPGNDRGRESSNNHFRDPAENRLHAG